MLPSTIDAQLAGLRKGLSEHGWEVAATEEPFEHEWWAAEFWTVESNWSPRGVRACLTFLVDPMSASTVWAVCATPKRPHQRPAAGAASMSLRHGWQQQLAPFIAVLGHLRHPPAPEAPTP